MEVTNSFAATRQNGLGGDNSELPIHSAMGRE
jgi:hypothetical protein